MTISKDRVKPSPLPDSWKLAEIFATGIVLGSYLAIMTVIFFWAAYKTDFFPVRMCHVLFLKWSLSLAFPKLANCLWCFIFGLLISGHFLFRGHLGCQLLRKQLMMTSGNLPLLYIYKWASLARPSFLSHALEVGPFLSGLECYFLWLSW